MNQQPTTPVYPQTTLYYPPTPTMQPTPPIGRTPVAANPLPQPIMQPMQLPTAQSLQPTIEASYSSVFDGTPLIAATFVWYSTGYFNETPCVLEWTSTNRIRAIDVDASMGQSIGVIFDIDPQQITKARTESSFIIIWINGQRNQFNFAGANTRLLNALSAGVSPSMGILYYSHTVQDALNNHYNWWWWNIQTYAPSAKFVDGDDQGLKIGVAIGLAIPFMAFVLAVIVVVIQMASHHP